MPTKKYDEDFKKMVVELYHKGTSVEQLTKDYGVIDKTIYRWIKLYSPDARTGITEAELLKLKKQLKDLQEDNEILKKALTIFAQKSNQK